MTVNLAWHDAMAEMGGAFNKTERSAGWTESFTVWQIAILQRPWKTGDKEGRRACNALSIAMRDACKTADLTHRILTVDVHVPVVQQSAIQGIENRTWETRWFEQKRNWFGQENEGQRRERLWRAANPPPTTKTEQREEIRVTAEAFAAWLAVNGIEPSRHVAAWFKAQAVDTTTTAPSATTAAAPAVTVLTAAVVPVKGVAGMNKEQREDARLDYCIEEGLQFNQNPLRPLPYGIGKVAEKLGMKRPSLSTDVRNALKRKAERERKKLKLVTPKK